MTTREEIIEMPAGSEIDGLIYKYLGVNPTKEPSIDIATAWEVIEKMENLGYSWRIQPDGGVFVDVMFSHAEKGYKGTLGAETTPLAICRSAVFARTE